MQLERIQRSEAIVSRAIKSELSSRFDAQETAFLERQLTQVRQQIYTVQYAELLGRSLLPIATDIAPTADNYVYSVYDRKGRARIAANAVNDIPRIDLVAFEVTGKVRNVEAAYGWDINSMREAARLGMDLPMLKANAAKAAIETGIDEMLAFGDLSLSTGQSNVGCAGLINNADVIAQGIVVPTNNTSFAALNADQQIANANQIANIIVSGSNQRWLPDTLAVSPAVYNAMASTPRSTTSDTSVLNWFKANNPYVKNVVQWYRLTGSGVGGKDRAIAFKRDPMVLEGIIPLEFEALPPQPTNFEFVVPCWARCGGCKIYQPQAVRYVDYTP
ncbi:MAG: DUF2184 domain-containing protein [Chthoniobacterales bacterium]|nr:DUF2184 domain-containing protein [Chthoniobacterales bacterium]